MPSGFTEFRRHCMVCPMTNMARIKQRIKALADKTVSNGCTEAEAIAAASMVDRLLERHALTMDEVTLQQQVCTTVEIPFKGRRSKPIDRCVPAVALFCDCKGWLTHRGTGGMYVFFGLEPDTVAASYLMNVIDGAIRTEAERFRWLNAMIKGRDLLLAVRSFQHGMASRMAERLGHMHADREAAVAAHHERGGALIVAKHSLVDEALSQTNTRLTPIPSKPIKISEDAFRAGQEAANDVDLSGIDDEGDA